MIKAKVEIVPGGRLPEKQHPEDACYDMYARQAHIPLDGRECIIDLGVKIQPEKGYRVAIYPRSSLSSKDWVLANSVGVGDQNYTGEYRAVFKFIGRGSPHGRQPYYKGDRVVQMELVPWNDIDFEVVESLEQTDRGEGGFGSTGK